MSSLNTPYVLIPTTLVDSMLTSATIAEPAAGETAWVSGGTYVNDDLRIVASQHSVYSCVLGHSGRTTSPELDDKYWLRKSATLRWAAFDAYASTQSKAASTISYVLRPGFCNAIDLLGLVGASAAITVKTGPGGTVALTSTQDLTEPYTGFYELLTSPPKQRTKLLLKDLPFLPDPEITITVTNGASGPVAIGMVAFGDLKPLLDGSDDLGVIQGAQAKPTTFSYIKTNTDGTWTIVKGGGSTDISFTVVLPLESANYTLSTIQSVLDVPCVWIGSMDSRFDGLNILGLASGSLKYGNPLCEFPIDVKGSL